MLGNALHRNGWRALKKETVPQLFAAALCYTEIGGDSMSIYLAERTGDS